MFSFETMKTATNVKNGDHSFNSNHYFLYCLSMHIHRPYSRRLSLKAINIKPTSLCITTQEKKVHNLMRKCSESHLFRVNEDAHQAPPPITRKRSDPGEKQ